MEMTIVLTLADISHLHHFLRWLFFIDSDKLLLAEKPKDALKEL